MKLFTHWFVALAVFFVSNVSSGMQGMQSSSTKTLMASRQSLSLAGEWRFASDPEGIGEKDNWPDKALGDRVRLPGTMDTNQKGTLNDKERLLNRLTRRYEYYGKAWYQRDIDIPETWAGKRVSLFLERTRATRVWLDGQLLEDAPQIRLSVPHIYLLPMVKPGQHTLSVEVDNSYKFPVRGHMTSEDCQLNWNGIIGRIELMATDPVWIDRVRVSPNVATKTASVELRVSNESNTACKGTVLLQAQSFNGGSTAPHKIPMMRHSLELPQGESLHTIQLPMGNDARLWSEFDPTLYELQLSIRSSGAKKKYRDNVRVEFGLREFRTQGMQCTINGKITFLRGKHDSLVSPITGYPAMDMKGALRFFQTVKDYGFNHVRYHTACPPEAAFQAASRLGIYLQPETPFWGSVDGVDDAPTGPYILTEGKAILDTYGNYPAFCIFSNGNEGGGKRQGRAEFVSHWRKYDNRFLYINGSNPYFWDPQQMPGDDLWVTCRTRNGADGAARASFSHANAPLGAIEAGPPNTLFDFRRALEGVTIPVIGHETGQYQTYPNFDEIKKYTGVVEARNFETFKERLDKAGMLDQWRDFFRVSGALSLLCYKEDIEIAIRTRDWGGFQMLDLQDFPGQGTALVGILDAFMDSKGIVSPSDWRKFCCETVPVLRFDRYTWTQRETFTADLQIAHYGAEDMGNTTVQWSLKSLQGKILSSGWIQANTVRRGMLSDLGQIKFDLRNISAPAKVNLVLSIPGTSYGNNYPLWVYPDVVKTDLAKASSHEKNVVIAKEWNAALHTELNNGATVLLIPENLKTGSATVGGLFMTDYWCFPMFRGICERGGREVSPGTLGLLCDPSHPAFDRFPTDDHTNWQWWHIIKNSRPLILDGTRSDYRPIAQMVDNFERNHKLGLIFESRVGKGKLLVCMADLWSVQAQPEARQLFDSLLGHAQSLAFKPTHTISANILERLTGDLYPVHPDQHNWTITASSEEKGSEAKNIMDGNPSTYWHSRWSNSVAKHPHTITIDLKNTQQMSGMFYLPRQKDSTNGTIKDWQVDISNDAKKWERIVSGTFDYPKKRITEQIITFPSSVNARFVRLTALSEINKGPWASASELRILTASQILSGPAEPEHDTTDYDQLGQ